MELISSLLLNPDEASHLCVGLKHSPFYLCPQPHLLRWGKGKINWSAWYGDGYDNQFYFCARAGLQSFAEECQLFFWSCRYAKKGKPPSYLIWRDIKCQRLAPKVVASSLISRNRVSRRQPPKCFNPKEASTHLCKLEGNLSLFNQEYSLERCFSHEAH